MALMNWAMAMEVLESGSGRGKTGSCSGSLYCSTKSGKTSGRCGRVVKARTAVCDYYCN